MMDKGKIIEALSQIIYPGSNRDIFSMHMIEKLELNENQVNIQLVLPSLESEHKEELNFACISEIQNIYPTAQVNVHLMARPENFKNTGSNTSPSPNTPNRLAKNILAVASGKGGVGKSTVATNLALALQQSGAKVGLVDLDLHGPSIPTMLGLQGQKLKIGKRNGKEGIEPLKIHGISVMSIGLVVAAEKAVVMRGPQLGSVITEFLTEVHWGDLDYLIIDLPPGTGDIHLSLVQTVPVTGVIMVTTPQRVALADAIKSVNMFRMNPVNVPIIGVIENMSWFTPEEFPDHTYYLFGKGGGDQLARLFQTKLLGQIPIVQSIREGGDAGQPAVLEEGSITGKYFMNIAKAMIEQVDKRNEAMPATKLVKVKHH